MDRLQAMQTFIAVAEAGGFTAAAERLGLPKASVSQRVAALETHLGTRLLQRSTRRVALTDDGRAYYAQCLRLLADLETVEAGLRGPTAGLASPRGLLRVDTLPSVAQWVIAPALADFADRYPQMSLQIGSTDRVVDLLEDGVDCAIRGGPLPDSSLVARRLCTVHMGVYASPDYLATHPVPHTPAEAATHRWVGRFQGAEGRVLRWEKTGAPRTEAIEMPRPSVTFAFNEGEAAVAASVAGLGLVVAPPFAVETELRRDQLTPVLPEWQLGRSALSAVYPSQRHLSPRLRCFVDWIDEIVQKHPSLALTPEAAAQRWASGHGTT
jgi:LysR family transcriptional regulator for bpeEF and oprC